MLTNGPNAGADPINPAYYAGTACAEIIEHMPTNVGFAAKYAWRLGEKDLASQEAGKAIWYLERELMRDPCHLPMVTGWYRTMAYHLTGQANQLGKLDFMKNEILSECIEYTLDGENRHLNRAIDLFRTYL